MASDEIVTLHCRCRWREQQGDAFIFVKGLDGWVFTDLDAPTRVSSWRARENNTGMPFVWQTCPSCGHDLPHIRLDPARFSQADGHTPKEEDEG